MERNGPQLLDYLVAGLGCDFLSDLKLQDRHTLWLALAAIPPERFPVKQWEDALHYLTGRQANAGMTAKTVRLMLLENLEASRGKQRKESVRG